MRKKEVVVVPDGFGRDVGKHFKITEWDVYSAEWWALRMLLLLKGTSARLPPDVERLGMVGVLIVGLNAFFAAEVDQVRLKPLLDEMMTRMQIVRDPRVQDPNDPAYPLATPLVGEDDIEEVKTLGWLRLEVLRVHTSFPWADALLALASQISRAAASTSDTTQTSQQ